MSEDVGPSAALTISVQASDSWIQVTSDGSGTFYLAHETSDATKRIGCMTSDACSYRFHITGLELDDESHVINVGLYRSDTATWTKWNHSDTSYPA